MVRPKGGKLIHGLKHKQSHRSERGNPKKSTCGFFFPPEVEQFAPENYSCQIER